MPRHPNHEFTAEDRAKGGRNRAAAIAQRKQEAQARVEQEFQARLDRLFERFDHVLATEDPNVVLRAVLAGFDRVAGKPTQHTELTGADQGPVVVENDVNADQAQAVIDSLIEAGLIARPSTNGHAEADEVHPA